MHLQALHEILSMQEHRRRKRRGGGGGWERGQHPPPNNLRRGGPTYPLAPQLPTHIFHQFLCETGKNYNVQLNFLYYQILR